jgi:hypothetical protein
MADPTPKPTTDDDAGWTHPETGKPCTGQEYADWIADKMAASINARADED